MCCRSFVLEVTFLCLYPDFRMLYDVRSGACIPLPNLGPCSPSFAPPAAPYAPMLVSLPMQQGMPPQQGMSMVPYGGRNDTRDRRDSRPRSRRRRSEPRRRSRSRRSMTSWPRSTHSRPRFSTRGRGQARTVGAAQAEAHPGHLCAADKLLGSMHAVYRCNRSECSVHPPTGETAPQPQPPPPPPPKHSWPTPAPARRHCLSGLGTPSGPPLRPPPPPPPSPRFRTMPPYNPPTTSTSYLHGRQQTCHQSWKDRPDPTSATSRTIRTGSRLMLSSLIKNEFAHCPSTWPSVMSYRPASMKPSQASRSPCARNL